MHGLIINESGQNDAFNHRSGTRNEHTIAKVDKLRVKKTLLPPSLSHTLITLCVFLFHVFRVRLIKDQ